MQRQRSSQDTALRRVSVILPDRTGSTPRKPTSVQEEGTPMAEFSMISHRSLSQINAARVCLAGDCAGSPPYKEVKR